MQDGTQRGRGEKVTTAEVEEVIPVLPAGIYAARFARITRERNEQGDYWYWVFVARDGANDVEITATSSPRLTPRTKAAKWLAGMGVNIEIGEAVNFDDLLDMPVQIVVAINEAGYSRIESVLPAATIRRAETEPSA